MNSDTIVVYMISWADEEDRLHEEEYKTYAEAAEVWRKMIGPGNYPKRRHRQFIQKAYNILDQD